MKSLESPAPDEIMYNSLLDGLRVSFFDVEHAECHDPLVRTTISIWILSSFSDQQLVGMKPSCNAAYLMQSTTSSTFHLSNLTSDLGFFVWEIRAWVDAGAVPVFALYLWQSSRREVVHWWCQYHSLHGRFRVHELGEHQTLAS